MMSVLLAMAVQLLQQLLGVMVVGQIDISMLNAMMLSIFVLNVGAVAEQLLIYPIIVLVIAKIVPRRK